MIRRSKAGFFRSTAPAAATVSLALLLAPCATHSAEPRPAPPPDQIELQPVRRSDLEHVEIQVADPRQTRPPRRIVSDLLVVLLPGRTPLDRAITQSGGHGTAAARRLFRARLIAVSGGRLIRGPTAWCGGFDRGLSICEVDCDGGRFSIRRNDTGEARFALIVGPGTPDDDSGERASGGVSLTSCSLDGADETRLVARRGAVADIALGDD